MKIINEMPKGNRITEEGDITIKCNVPQNSTLEVTGKLRIKGKVGFGTTIDVKGKPLEQVQRVSALGQTVTTPFHEGMSTSTTFNRGKLITTSTPSGKGQQSSISTSIESIDFSELEPGADINKLISERLNMFMVSGGVSISHTIENVPSNVPLPELIVEELLENNVVINCQGITQLRDVGNDCTISSTGYLIAGNIGKNCEFNVKGRTTVGKIDDNSKIQATGDIHYEWKGECVKLKSSLGTIALKSSTTHIAKREEPVRYVSVARGQCGLMPAPRYSSASVPKYSEQEAAITRPVPAKYTKYEQMIVEARNFLDIAYPPTADNQNYRERVQKQLNDYLVHLSAGDKFPSQEKKSLAALKNRLQQDASSDSDSDAESESSPQIRCSR